MAGEINLTVHPIANDVFILVLCAGHGHRRFVKIMPGIGASGMIFKSSSRAYPITFARVRRRFLASQAG